MVIGNLKGLKRSFFALVAVLPVSCGQITVQPTASDAQGAAEATSTLSLTTEGFPDGAEKLVLSVTKAGAPIPCWVSKTETTSVPVTVNEGLGLSQASDNVHCIPPHFTKTTTLEIANKPNFAWEKIIEVKKGEEIAPIKLRAGSYYARANFYNASSMLLYLGDEKFTLAAGEQKSLRIRL